MLKCHKVKGDKPNYFKHPPLKISLKTFTKINEKSFQC